MTRRRLSIALQAALLVGLVVVAMLTAPLRGSAHQAETRPPAKISLAQAR